MWAESKNMSFSEGWGGSAFGFLGEKNWCVWTWFLGKGEMGRGQTRRG